MTLDEAVSNMVELIRVRRQPRYLFGGVLGGEINAPTSTNVAGVGEEPGEGDLDCPDQAFQVNNIAHAFQHRSC